MAMTEEQRAKLECLLDLADRFALASENAAKWPHYSRQKWAVAGKARDALREGLTDALNAGAHSATDADTARLDWLERTGADIVRFTSDNAFYNGVTHRKIEVEWSENGVTRYAGGGMLREAIDAAMKG